MDMTQKYLGTEQPVGRIKLSEAIREGIPHVEERESHYGCALACAVYSLIGMTPMERFERSGFRLMCLDDEDTAKLGGWPLPLVQKISINHHMRKWTREQCADYAESQGF